MDGKRLSAAAKAVVTVCFLGFMTFFCLGRLLIALAVLFVGIVGFILLTALQIRLENREQRHFIRNILTEYGKIINEDKGDYKKRGLAFLESELEYSRTHPRLACNKNYLGIFLAAHYGNLADMDKCGGYIDMVSPEELMRDGDIGWFIVFYSIKMDITVKKGEHTAAKELYEQLCGEIDMEKYRDDPNLIKMRSEYLLLCGDHEGALAEAERLGGEDLFSRFAAFQCRFNALLSLGRLEEAEELVRNMRSSEVPDQMLPVFGEFEAAIKHKKEAMQLNKEKSV
ncbi:MAG: hypothetical protein ACI4J0_10610 [Huintestinicola sp.]|uniref:hypothetical protein n=1 Tax=Huintestinicola sp. TaxID=2981661 RepID=UPI003F0E5DED